MAEQKEKPARQAAGDQVPPPALSSGEQALARVLEAAYILQEHKGNLPVSSKTETAGRAAQASPKTQPPEVPPAAKPSPDGKSPEDGNHVRRDAIGDSNSAEAKPPLAVGNTPREADRAAVLAALAELKPNLAALAESMQLDDKAGKNSAPSSSAIGQDLAADTNPPAATEEASGFLCRKCGHALVAGEQFCGQCGRARSNDYEPPNMQTKVATLWLMQQAGKHSAAAAAAEGGARRSEGGSSSAAPDRANSNQTARVYEVPRARAHLEPGLRKSNQDLADRISSHTEGGAGRMPAFDPSAADELPDLFAMPEIKKALADLEDVEMPRIRAKITEEKENVERPIASLNMHTDTLHTDPELEAQLAVQEDELARELAEENLFQGPQAAEKSADPKSAGFHKAERDTVPQVALATTARAGQTWSSAAEARAFFERMAVSSRKNDFVRFWNARRGDVYLAVAVLLVGGVIRWGIHSSRAADLRAQTARHQAADPNADLSFFDRMLISLGLAEAPDRAPEYKGNPGVQVWVDTHTALYYCPGADLYGKTPQGKLTTQRDAQLDQFEPAFQRACD